MARRNQPFLHFLFAAYIARGCLCYKQMEAEVLGRSIMLEDKPLEYYQALKVPTESNKIVTLVLYGHGFNSSDSSNFLLSLGIEASKKGHRCADHRLTEPVVLNVESDFVANVSFVSSQFRVVTDQNLLDFFICLKKVLKNGSEQPWFHQGDDERIKISVEYVKEGWMTLTIKILISLVLISLSGLFSGLNLGLMSIDNRELKILRASGTEREKKYSKIITPVRKNGNYLLCTILLGNVLVNNTLAILLDEITGSGKMAIIVSTLAIVVCGEIIPQALCSRYGLAVGAKTIWLTKFFMVITFPLSMPISKILDRCLGPDVGRIYNKKRLTELIKSAETELGLQKHELDILTGTLDLSNKTVKDVMTKLDDVFMLEYETVLNFEVMSEIIHTGYTRIPVYQKERQNIVALINTKDFALVDPDDCIPLKLLIKFHNHPVHFVFQDMSLTLILEEFKIGRSHMSFVQKVNNEGDGDPFYETLGVVTLEDVIEEIIQSEIIDETDTVIDNKRKERRTGHQMKDYSVFKTGEETENYPRLNPQQFLATFQFLQTSIPAFRPEIISETVLQRLLKQNVVVNLSVKDANSVEAQLYTAGKAYDYFILILQGRCEVKIGKDGMVFEGGPYMYLGVQALTGTPGNLSKHQSISSISSVSDNVYSRPNNYIPDYSARALCNIQYLRIRRAHYIAAKRATQIERQPKNNPDEDAFGKEWKRAISIHPDNQNCNSEVDQDGRDRSETVDSLNSDSIRIDTPLVSEDNKPSAV